MRMIRLMILILMLNGFGAAYAQDASDEEQIEETLTAMWAAIEVGDVDLYATYVHPDYTAFGENDVYLSEGKALEVRNVADWVSQAKGVHTEMHNAEVTVRGDVAWITYYWMDSGVQRGQRFSSRGKSTRIFVKEEGRWLCIHAHFTAVP